LITHEQIPDFYGWLSRYVQVSNWLSYRTRALLYDRHSDGRDKNTVARQIDEPLRRLQTESHRSFAVS
jgi:hypothetical protein